MTTQQVRAVLAIGVVGVSLIVVACLAIHPLVSANVDYDHWTEVFGKLVAPFTGLIGVIIGYYFGQKD
jgi:hypothetical protein